MMLTTNFNLLKQANACTGRYRHLARALGGIRAYGREAPITLLQVLDANGLDDALWALRAVPREQEAVRDRFARLLACDYAEHILPIAWDPLYPTDRRPWTACAVARRYACGGATTAELAAAARGAWEARAAAAWAAARAAARAAASAAWASAGASASAWAAAAARAAARAASAGAASAEHRAMCDIIRREIKAMQSQ